MAGLANSTAADEGGGQLYAERVFCEIFEVTMGGLVAELDGSTAIAKTEEVSQRRVELKSTVLDV